MRLKELITRSGGVITAIALLGSMMSMAGAAIGTFLVPYVPNPIPKYQPI